MINQMNPNEPWTEVAEMWPRCGRDVAIRSHTEPYGAIRSHTAPVSKLPLDGMHQWQWYRHGNPVGDSPGGGLVSDAKLRTDQSPSEFIRVQKVRCCQCISNHINAYLNI